MIEQFGRAGFPIYPRENRWIGGGIDQPVHRSTVGQIGGVSHIPGAGVDVLGAQDIQVLFAAGTRKIINTGDLDPLAMCAQSQTARPKTVPRMVAWP